MASRVIPLHPNAFYPLPPECLQDKLCSPRSSCLFVLRSATCKGMPGLELLHPCNAQQDVLRSFMYHVCLPQVKMHWVHDTYWLPGPQGNDIHKTNVPNLRMRFRYDNHQEEVQTVCTAQFCLGYT